MSEVKVTTVETEERQPPLSVFLNGARLAASPLVDLPVQTPKTARLVWNSFTAPADAKLIQQLIDDDLLPDSSERRKWALSFGLVANSFIVNTEAVVTKTHLSDFSIVIDFELKKTSAI